MTLDEAAQSRLEVESVSFKSRKSRKVNICMELRKFAILSLWRRSCISEELAERIGIDSSPLSKAIMQLESELGVQLFVRARRSTRLTHVGEMLLGDARRFLAALAYCFWCRLADTRIAKLFVQSFIQGLSAGGQIGGTISLLMEHAAEEKRREFLAWQQASVGAFYLLAGAIG